MNIGPYIFFVVVGFARIRLDWDEPDSGVEGLSMKSEFWRAN